MALLRGPARKCLVYCHGTVDSTNLLLKKMAEDGAPEGTVIIADAQTRGRGQRGRAFYSPAGTGLYISVLLRQTLHGQTRYITAAAAVAAAEAIEEICGLPVGIKWVNDIYLQGKKAGGILTESSFECESGHAVYAVLGLGLNVAAPERGFPSELSGSAAFLYAPGAAPEADMRGMLAAEFLSRLLLYAGRPEKVLPAYRRMSCLLGQRLACYSDGRVFAAEAVDIDDEARLVVRLSDGREETLSAGEVTVMPEKRDE
jgi:BirA family biotin operon repressor/biotin-[acetyl-CoA-carboxylase] ligase